MFTQIGFPIIDIILANILGLLIVYTGFGIFKESIFTLSDGFNEQDLEEYRLDILEVEDVIDVNNIKGRYHGSSIFIDVTIVVDPYLHFMKHIRFVIKLKFICIIKEFRLYMYIQNPILQKTK